MSSKEERKRIISSGDPLARHSLNNSHMSYVLRQNELFYGLDRKAAKSSEKRRKHERFLEELPRYQFDRAMGHLLNGDAGGATPEDLNYVFNNIRRYERRIYGFSTEDAKVIITIVDFVGRVPAEKLRVAK